MPVKKLSLVFKKKLFFFLIFLEILLIALCFRLFYIFVVEGGKFQEMAYEQQTRDRLITPYRGIIYDRNMTPIAANESLYAISVIHNQVKQPEQVAQALSDALGLNYDDVYEKVKRVVALVRIQNKVDKATADKIRALNMPGVIIDEDIKRVYPFGSMASQVIGFVGGDNQGIIGLEAKYDEYLKGEPGKILTETDVRGIELPNGEHYRIPPVPGYNLVTSIDVNLQQFAEQTIDKIVQAKEAKRGVIILMNPQNGEIYAMANKPDFDLNAPFTINDDGLKAIWDTLSSQQQMDDLNQMWRNFAINDTYEPGSTAKIITSAAGLAEGVVTPDSQFVCNGSVTVGGRTIKCWRFPRAHGTESFVEGVQNSCNPVFMAVADRLGKENLYKYYDLFGLNAKTGVDLAGEASGIFHKLENVGPVELATMSFGQSFQITPLELLRSVSAVINGGYMVTPHFMTAITDDSGNIIESFDTSRGEPVISQSVSDTMREILKSVVDVGTGNRTYIPGYQIGGKTATSEKLPRGSGKYIASFLAFAPADKPQVIAIVLIDEPQGAHFGGAVAGPVMKELLSNVLPYLGVVPTYTDAELNLPGVKTVTLPDFTGLSISDAKSLLQKDEINYTIIGNGDTVDKQFPIAGTVINQETKMLIYLNENGGSQ